MGNQNLNPKLLKNPRFESFIKSKSVFLEFLTDAPLEKIWLASGVSVKK